MSSLLSNCICLVRFQKAGHLVSDAAFQSAVSDRSRNSTLSVVPSAKIHSRTAKQLFTGAGLVNPFRRPDSPNKGTANGATRQAVPLLFWHLSPTPVLQVHRAANSFQSVASSRMFSSCRTRVSSALRLLKRPS